MRWRLALETSTPAITSACAFSWPAGAPSSQSQVTSKIGPSVSWSSSALRISFSLPAKCSQDGMTGKGRSPLNSASFGWVLIPRRASARQQVFHPVPFLEQLLERVVHLLAAEVVDLQALHQRVLATRAGDGHAVHDIGGNAVFAVRRDSHRDPLAVRAEHPVADVADRRVGRRS